MTVYVGLVAVFGFGVESVTGDMSEPEVQEKILDELWQHG